MDKIQPTVYKKFTININPPIVYGPDDIISQDVVITTDRAKVTEILNKTYGTKYKRDFSIIKEEEVILFQNSYTKLQDEDELPIKDKEEDYENEY